VTRATAAAAAAGRAMIAVRPLAAADMAAWRSRHAAAQGLRGRVRVVIPFVKRRR
jgi:hypothetical protein